MNKKITRQCIFSECDLYQQLDTLHLFEIQYDLSRVNTDAKRLFFSHFVRGLRMT